MIYNIQQRVFFVKTYYERKSIVAVQRAYKTKFNQRMAPARSSILAAVKNFEKMEM